MVVQLPSVETRFEEFARKNGFRPIGHRRIPGGDIYVAERYYPNGLPEGNAVNKGKSFYRIMWSIRARSFLSGKAAFRGNYADLNARVFQTQTERFELGVKEAMEWLELMKQANVRRRRA